MHNFLSRPRRNQINANAAVCALTSLALMIPSPVYGQCPSADSAKAKAALPTASSSPQFYDEPHFTVAGVADTTNLGGHGSDTVVRTKAALAKDTVSLTKPDGSDVSTTSHVKETALREALKRDSQNAELRHSLGEVEENLKHPLEAVREYQRAAELNPSEPYLFDWGAELLAHRAPEAAIEVFTKGNRLFPTSTRMLIGLGVALHARGSYDQAAACLCAASDLNPDDAAPYIFLAKMYVAGTIQSPGVVDRLERFARLYPENALSNYYYAFALWKGAKGAADAALATQVQSLLEKAIRLDPKLGLAYLLQGVVDSDLGDWSKAIAAYEKAIDASPQVEEAHYRLAQAYRRVGEKTKAQRELRIYERLSKSSAEQAERERHEILQIVVAMRDAKTGSAEPAKP